MNSQTSLLTVEQLADVFNRHPHTIKRWVAARRIPFIKIGQTIRFDLEAVIEATTTKPAGRR